MKALALIGALLPGAAGAQSLAAQLADAPEIPFAEWRDMTAGKTVVYQVGGETYGYERYTGPGQVTIRLTDGTCIDGSWYMQGSAFCFDWQGGPLNCFHHKRLGEAVYVIGLGPDGAETDDIQKVARIADIPLACGPALTSALSVGRS